ncbi:FGGY carbohydrate kinase domain-containing protein-like protein [Dinothrombium tinctorium]|uniref:FGGY carbohydrate kinase domain-containing protein-like protein n=1 Tax=Dinothrombium tinctorium TaxID=1965070 RepID=A0A443RNV8_9ACAR|nr:FGGY carbohydrate kinase domain-containing protein-like protein [Dinothrombium tinctorium]
MNLSKLNTILVCGGLAKNEIYIQTHADVLNCEVITMRGGDADMMLIGCALLARQAALRSDLSVQHLQNISMPDLQMQSFNPNSAFFSYHEAKYQCYKKLMDTAQEVEKLMSASF